MARRESTKHAAVAEQLRELVLELAPGEALPGERQLAERWGVARTTLRHAIAALAREGLVRSVHGRGTLRSPAPLLLRVRLGSFADAVRDSHLTPSTTTLECVVDEDPPEDVEQFFEGAPVIRLRRLRFGDDVPLALEKTWLPLDLVPDLMTGTVPDSLYAYLEEHRLLPDLGEECVVAGLPDADEIRHLDVAASRPVLRLSRKAFMGGRPIEYAEAVFPADRYQLWFPLTRG